MVRAFLGKLVLIRYQDCSKQKRQKTRNWLFWRYFIDKYRSGFPEHHLRIDKYGSGFPEHHLRIDKYGSGFPEHHLRIDKYCSGFPEHHLRIDKYRPGSLERHLLIHLYGCARLPGNSIMKLAIMEIIKGLIIEFSHRSW
jgi:hypothetical protein